MTHMTETGRTLASGRCSLQRSRTALEQGASSTVAGISMARAFALRGECAVPDSNATEDRAFPRGDDS